MKEDYNENKKCKKELKKESKKNEKALKKSNVDKERFGTKFIKAIKQKWLIKGTTTLLLIAILIGAFILINIGVSKLNITSIDCTAEQTYTLTDESKERIKDIEEEVNIYFTGFDESSTPYILAEQYNKANSNIKVEIVDITTNLEFKEKYEVTEDSATVIIECGENIRTLNEYDLYTYDSSYNYTDISEQKITSAILNVVADDVAKVYFLKGYTSMTFDSGLTYIAQYLKDEVLTYDTLDILVTGKVPEDCNTLVIMTPEKDFDDITTKAIKNYIKTGGNILWMNSAIVDKSIKFDNVNKILAEYGVKGFDVGYIYETSANNILLGNPMCFLPEIQSADITEDISSSGTGVAFIQGTKININTEKLEKLNVEKTDLLTTDDTAYFTTDLTGKTNTKTDEKGGFVVGAQLVKTLSEDDEESDEEVLTSTLVIYGDNYFIADVPVTYDSYGYVYAVQLYNNANLMLNSVASLTDNDQDITIRKSYADTTTTFTATDGEISIIVKIIFVVPVAIIALGIIVWIIRKNKK